MNSILALLCVLMFSFTVPATRIASLALAPEAVSALRLLGAGVVCALTLIFVERWVPPRRAWPGLLATAFGSVVGFSLFLALAMKSASATHGAIATAAIPALTAAYASLRAGVDPGLRFWVFSAMGTASTLLFFAGRSSGELGIGDIWLIAAVVVAAFGYVEGARLSREFGGRRIMSWAVVLAMPLASVATLVLYRNGGLEGLAGQPRVWIALAYLALVSQAFGMFLWYRVLARGDMAKVALIQLIQPFLTLVAAAYLLGETMSPVTWLTAALVVICVFGANRARAQAGTESAAKTVPTPGAALAVGCISTSRPS